MLSSYDLAILDGICETARAYRYLDDWDVVVIYDDGQLAVSLTEDPGYIEVTLRGARKHQFNDWLAACADRCVLPDRPLSNRQGSQLDDQIVFRHSVAKV
jgi:hypothetical protein